MIQVLVIDNEGTTTHILHLHGSRSASTRAPLKSINQEHPQCHPQSLNVSLSPTGHRQDPSRTTEPEPAEARLDCVVFGRVAGRAAAKWLGGSRGLADPMEVPEEGPVVPSQVQLLWILWIPGHWFSEKPSQHSRIVLVRRCYNGSWCHPEILFRCFVHSRPTYCTSFPTMSGRNLVGASHRRCSEMFYQVHCTMSQLSSTLHGGCPSLLKADVLTSDKPPTMEHPFARTRR